MKTPNHWRLTALLAGAITASTALTACAPLLIGGAVLGGSMFVVDRRSSGAQIDDQTIELKGVTRAEEASGKRGVVGITSYNRLVLITGAVPTDADKAAVEQAISRIEGVRSVVSEMAVGPASSLVERSKDTLITTKVKASLVDAKDLQANAFKVLTERGVVYLMGIVTEREAARAAHIARGVSGVRKVVRVFEVVTENELANPKDRPVPAPAGKS